MVDPDLRTRLRGLSDAASAKGDPLSWFEELYDLASGDDALIPWSRGRAHPALIPWLDRTKVSGRALVVGCGLGEDAIALADRGWRVTAFDLSATAVAWAASLAGDRDIEWIVADLQKPPQEWIGAFDLVLEVHILQAIPERARHRAAKVLPELVASNGHLVCIGRLASSDDGPPDGPPWPLTESYLRSVGQGLDLIRLDRLTLEGEPTDSRYLMHRRRQDP